MDHRFIILESYKKPLCLQIYIYIYIYIYCIETISCTFVLHLYSNMFFDHAYWCLWMNDLFVSFLGSCKIHITDYKVQINSLTVKKCLQTSYGSHPHHMKIICDSTCHSSWIADSHKLQPGATFSITVFL